MSFALAFDAPYSTARTTTNLVPDPYPVSIAGKGFMLDDGPDIPRDQHAHASVQYLTKFLTSPVFGSPTSVNEVGETSLNPDVNWRRSTASWNGGAGQQHFDLRDSDRARFRSSKGIDPWTIGQFSLLHDTTSARVSANTNLMLETAGSYLYLADGSSLVYSTDAVTWSSAVTGLSGTLASITSDGHSVWCATPGGTYQTTRGGTSAAKFNDLVPDLVAYRKGRLMAAKANSIYNITTSYLPGPPTGLTVTGIASAQRSHTYALGAVVVPVTPNGHWYKATTAGTTGSSIPTWPTTSGGTVTDGTVVWTEQGATATNTYRVTALNSAGETLACSEVGALGAGTVSAVAPMVLSWTAVTGATLYRLYGRTAGAELLLDSTSSITYTDAGTATPSSALPTADTTGSAPAPLFTHDNTDWTWVGFATGDTCVYAAGSSGDYSAVYRIPLKADGTGLDAPIQAGELPKGETALSILGYLGFVFIGTSAGLRLATQNTSGELQLGSVIPSGPARTLAGFGRFCWFGWENYDTTSTGLGRADVTVINTDAPAYATDLMAAAQGHVTSVAVFNSAPVFAVSGVGVFTQSASLVPTGSVDSGLVTFDLPDPKVAQAIDVRHSTPLLGTHSVYLSTDQGPFALLGTHTPQTQETPFVVDDAKGDVFEIRHTLTPGSLDTTVGPVLSRWTLMAIPAALSGEQITVPLRLSKTIYFDSGASEMRDCAADLAFLKGLRKSKLSFAYQEGGVTYRGSMQDYQWLPQQLTDDRQAWEGTFLATILIQDVTT